MGLGTTGAGAGLFVAGVISGVGTIPALIVGGATVVSAIITKESGPINEINYILISKYDTVSDKCAVESGVGEK